MVGVVRDGFGIPLASGVFFKYINIGILLDFVPGHQVCRFYMYVQSPVGWSLGTFYNIIKNLLLAPHAYVYCSYCFA